jgi:hypothetical protein
VAQKYEGAKEKKANYFYLSALTKMIFRKIYKPVKIFLPLHTEAKY